MRSRSSAGKWRLAKPWIPPWSTSSAPQETSITRSPSTGVLRSRSASATRTATALRLSLAPGTTGLPRDVGEHRRADAASRATPAAIAARAVTGGAERDQRGHREHRPPQRQRGVDPLDHARERSAEHTPGPDRRRSRRSARRRGGRARRASARRRGRRSGRPRSRSAAAAPSRGGTAAARWRCRRRSRR